MLSAPPQQRSEPRQRGPVRIDPRLARAHAVYFDFGFFEDWEQGGGDGGAAALDHLLLEAGGAILLEGGGDILLENQ
jgi:hypothetical protein